MFICKVLSSHTATMRWNSLGLMGAFLGQRVRQTAQKAILARPSTGLVFNALEPLRSIVGGRCKKINVKLSTNDIESL
jgi:hypothetical protein